MAATEISRIFIPETLDGSIDLNDLTVNYSDCPSGASNGVIFVYNPKKDFIVLGPGASLVTYTILTPEPSPYAALSITISNPQIVVDDSPSERRIFKLPSLFVDTSGKVTITSSVNGKILVLRMLT